MFIAMESCNRPEYPIEPELTFKSHKLIVDADTLTAGCVLIFEFTDGDGDIGSNEDGVTNLFVDYFEIQNGIPTQVTNPLDSTIINFNSRIPVITPKGANKSISGTISDTIHLIGSTSLFDTIMFSIYLEDRAMHRSNTIESPLILVKRRK